MRSYTCSEHPNATETSNYTGTTTTTDFELETSWNLSAANNETDEDAIRLCWQNHTLTRLNVYRLFLVGFICVFGPFAAFSVQKTKYLQIITVIFRWCGKLPTSYHVHIKNNDYHRNVFFFCHFLDFAIHF